MPNPTLLDRPKAYLLRLYAGGESAHPAALLKRLGSQSRDGVMAACRAGTDAATRQLRTFGSVRFPDVRGAAMNLGAPAPPRAPESSLRRHCRLIEPYRMR